MKRNIFILLVLVITLSNSFLLCEAYDIVDRLNEDYNTAIKAGCEDKIVKKPGLAAGLGILPGGGSFYTGNIGVGVLDLLLWPFSVLWDPFVAHGKAKERNKFATVEFCKTKQPPSANPPEIQN